MDPQTCPEDLMLQIKRHKKFTSGNIRIYELNFRDQGGEVSKKGALRSPE